MCDTLREYAERGHPLPGQGKEVCHDRIQHPHLGLAGIRWLNRSGKALHSANEAVLPFYVLQQPAVIVIAFYVVQWDMDIGLKWLIISALALALILSVYELLIRRVNATRWLFGMKPRQRTPRKDLNGREQEGHPAEAPGGKAEQSVPLSSWKEAPSGTMPGQSSEHAFTG